MGADRQPFPYANRVNRQTENFREGNDDAASSTAIQLGHNQTGNGNHLLEHLDLLQGILSRGGVQYQQHRVRSRCVLFAQHADDLGQFLHQCGLVVQAARGVDQQDVGALGFRLRQRIERETGGVSVLPARDHRGSSALAPNLQLLHRRGTKRIARGHDRALALFLDTTGPACRSWSSCRCH